MKVIILGAGYGTRLLKDLQNGGDEFKHLVGIPKPLLPIGHLPLISHWMAAFQRSSICDIYLVTNHQYYPKFEEWALQYKAVKIVDDGTQKNEERLGAVACLQLAIDTFKISDHVMVVGGDTLFLEDFSLHDVISKFQRVQTEDDQANIVLSYQCKDEVAVKPSGPSHLQLLLLLFLYQETVMYGILETDKNLRVTAMKEKPSSDQTESRWACPCFYVLSKNTLPLVQEFLQEKKNAQIEEKDAPGHFISWLVPRKPVYVHPISGRFDVGNLQSYVICNTYFQERIHTLANYLR
ncbi:uncharacterized protein [Pleurodeles waltl]|uniref:uncharacterized protein isoform X1 n=1 Tax=Pleurodeles waltl TaxID=8319 RepID=UPI0037093F5D